MSGNKSEPAKTVIEEIGMTGDAIAEGGSVVAVSGGEDHLPEGSHIRRVAMEKNARAINATVKASENRKLFVVGQAGKEDRVDGNGTAEKSTIHFGHDDTAAILLAGAGEDSATFEKDVESMNSLLIGDHVGISKTKITCVLQKASKTKTAIKNAINEVVEILENKQNGHFIFYYSGHFNKRNKFKVDDKGNDDDEYLDKDLATELMRIPAKYMLFILDCCYAGAADVGAKVDDDGLAQGDEEAPMPRLWMFFDKSIQAKGDEVGSKGPPIVAEKIVQWASTQPEQKSFNHKKSEYSFFTNAVLEIITDHEKGRTIREELTAGETHVTVPHLNKHVTDHMKRALKEYGEVQNPVIEPTEGDKEYFKAFPCFAKIK